jgi:hypothetical protein
MDRLKNSWGAGKVNAARNPFLPAFSICGFQDSSKTLAGLPPKTFGNSRSCGRVPEMPERGDPI